MAEDPEVIRLIQSMIDRIPFGALAITCAAVVMATGAWSYTKIARTPAVFTMSPPPAVLAGVDEAHPGEQMPSVPERAWIATLYDDIDPQPSPEAIAESAAPPPKLNVELKAILVFEGARRVFVLNRADEEYLTLAPGDHIGSAVLTRVEAGAAVFTLGSREIRLEIDG